LVPAPDGLDNFVWIGSPCEGFWFCVVLDNKAIDGCLQVDDRLEDAALEAPATPESAAAWLHRADLDFGRKCSTK
jgi:hypothetical protein